MSVRITYSCAITIDYQFLTEFGDTDYGLAPEVQYPHSMNQCYTVYKWILTGGLGFQPGKIALFGESAGAYHCAFLWARSI